MDGKKRVAARRKMEAWKKINQPPGPVTKGQRLKAEQVRRERKMLDWKVFDPVVVGLKAGVELRMENFGLVKKIKSPPPEDREGMVQVQGRYGDTVWVQKSPLKSPWRYIEWLKKKGFVELGSGAYSTVLAKPNSNRVIKVSRSLDNWIDYVQWASKAGFAGTLAPRVYSWKRHSYKHDFAVAIVERMKEPARGWKTDQELLLGLQTYARNGNLLAQCYMEEIIPGSVNFFSELSRQDLDGDIGGRNVMLREDGTLCITDPCCGNIRTKTNRLRSGDLSPSALSYLGSNESSYRYRSQCSYQS